MSKTMRVQDSKRQKSRLDYAEALNKIQFEHTLIHHRMSWLFTSQGFFIAAYFTLKLKSGALTAEPEKGDLPQLGEYCTLLSIPAALTALIFYFSILAAHLAMRIWLKRAEENRRDALISGFPIHYLGDAPASIISLVFFTFWLNLILLDFKLVHYDKTVASVLTIATIVVGSLIWSLVTFSKFRLGPAPQGESSAEFAIAADIDAAPKSI